LPDLENEYGEIVTRNTSSFEQENLKIRHLLTYHASAIPIQLQNSRWAEGVVRSDENVYVSQLTGLGCAAMFFVLVAIAKRI